MNTSPAQRGSCAVTDPQLRQQPAPFGPAPVPHRRAAQLLQSQLSEVLDAYHVGLLKVGSMLAEHPEPWRSARREAISIVEDCATTLTDGVLPETEAAEEYSRLLGANRALQRIPMAESIRAAEIFWNAVQPVVHAAAASAPPEHRVVIWQKLSVAFRTAASVRLYAGARGYEETRDRIVFTGADAAPVAAAQAARAGEPAEELTPRERQILDAVACALTNREIASRLGIGEGTVKRHLHNIFTKLEATSRMEAVLKGANSR